MQSMSCLRKEYEAARDNFIGYEGLTLELRNMQALIISLPINKLHSFFPDKLIIDCSKNASDTNFF